jgi:MoxR-like ATPase
VTTEEAVAKIADVIANIEMVVKGKTEAVRQAIVTLLARGHLLIEDVPGVGKTVLAHSLAQSLNCTFRRVQFTSDLLPSDILGVNIFNQSTRDFEFRSGPIFSNIVLADEINRATPKTQSSLLEAMSEGQVSVENETMELPQPFMVIATQNPIEYYGTYPLPESQLDRFHMRIRIGYPEREFERMIITGMRSSEKLAAMTPVLNGEEVATLQERVDRVRVEATLQEYLLEIVARTRASDRFQIGVSPRGAISLYRCAQAMAVLEGRDFCVPDDVKRLAVPCFAHRVILASRRRDGGWSGAETAEAVAALVEGVPVPH